jgi:hypothetical protein
VRRASICQHLLWWGQLWCVPQGKKKLLSGVLLSLAFCLLQIVIFCAAKHNALWELLQSIQHSMHFQCCKAQCIQHHELFSAMKIS